MAEYKLINTDQLDADLTSVADAIRAKTGGTEALAFPEDFAASQEDVFQAGQKTEYDRFWDLYQDYGNRTSYQFGFASGWKADLIWPKYDMHIDSAYMMFMYSPEGIDLAQRAEECGIVIDFSRCTNFQYAFTYCGLRRLGVIDTRSCAAFNHFAIGSGYLTTIDEIILKEDGSQKIEVPDAFFPPALQHIVITGKIGSTVSCISGNLTKASIISVVNALLETASGKTLTLSRYAVNLAFGSVDSDEWAALVASRSNWTISLV